MVENNHTWRDGFEHQCWYAIKNILSEYCKTVPNSDAQLYLYVEWPNSKASLYADAADYGQHPPPDGNFYTKELRSMWDQVRKVKRGLESKNARVEIGVLVRQPGGTFLLKEHGKTRI